MPTEDLIDNNLGFIRLMERMSILGKFRDVIALSGQGGWKHIYLTDMKFRRQWHSLERFSI